MGSRGAWASVALALLDDVTASPASRRLASAHAALRTRACVLSPRAVSLNSRTRLFWTPYKVTDLIIADGKILGVKVQAKDESYAIRAKAVLIAKR